MTNLPGAQASRPGAGDGGTLGRRWSGSARRGQLRRSGHQSGSRPTAGDGEVTGLRCGACGAEATMRGAHGAALHGMDAPNLGPFLQ